MDKPEPLLFFCFFSFLAFLLCENSYLDFGDKFQNKKVREFDFMWSSNGSNTTGNYKSTCSAFPATCRDQFEQFSFISSPSVCMDFAKKKKKTGISSTYLPFIHYTHFKDPYIFPLPCNLRTFLLQKKMNLGWV